MHFQPTSGQLRFYDAGQSYEAWDDYRAVGTVFIPIPGLAFVSATHGMLKKSDVLGMCDRLAEHQVRLAYIFRAPGHRMPLAKRVRCGPLKGAWEIKIGRRAETPSEPLGCAECGRDTGAAP